MRKVGKPPPIYVNRNDIYNYEVSAFVIFHLQCCCFVTGSGNHRHFESIYTKLCLFAKLSMRCFLALMIHACRMGNIK